MKWQPIETAPKGGDVLMLYCGGAIIIGYYETALEWGKGSDPVNSWVDYDFEPGDKRLNPTHWMPLPEPPEES